MANVKNREKRPVQVQISIVFKDLTATSTCDESPWKNVMLSPYETQAIEFTAMNNLAKKYTIRVRQAR